MIQTVIAFLLLTWATLYFIWRLMPVAWRRRLFRAAAPRLERTLAHSAVANRASGCSSCAGCKGCD